MFGLAKQFPLDGMLPREREEIMGRRSGKLVRNYGRDERVKIAGENREARSKRSPEQQIASLDKRLGKGKGASKERGRLLKQMEDAKKPKVNDETKTKAKEENTEPKPKVKAKDRKNGKKKSAAKETA